MDFQLTFSFFIAAALLALMPGPDNMYVLTESITRGFRNGFALSCGLSSGVMVHTLMVATGMSLVLYSSHTAFQVVKYLGAAYLLYLAYQATIEKKGTLHLAEEKTVSFNFWKLYRQGFLMNVLNPKVSLFFIALLPQFVSKDGFSPGLQMIILGVIFMLTALFIFSAIARLAGRLAPHLQSDRFWKWTKYARVSVLLALAGMLFV